MNQKMFYTNVFVGKIQNLTPSRVFFRAFP